MNFQQLWRYQDRFAEGVVLTITLTGISAVAGTLIGLLGAMLIRSGPRPVRWLIRSYIEIIRNTPSLIQIFLIFFVLPAFGIKLPPFEAASVALSIYFGAYAIEIIRSGLDTIPRSQIEAGACLGLSRWEVFRHIVLAPALRNIYPAFTSQFVLLLLGTSIASQISAEELFHTASFIESRTYRSFEVYAVVCAIYFALVIAFKVAFAIVGRLAFRWPTRR
ncbi:ABC transporter permease subunit [Microvirga mediterraneensis]|uniref:Amino acid ABC transporter permease n=1 Tax=Microvirga mediterraneensis TaxID=2754695 RepID=A0A838BJA2_9HYPH|nr:amino acid ABC transporter permease [Microvirga mediterraneensis]